MKKTVVAISLALVALPALALYKVVGPDGKVTYTDRPPSDGNAKVVPMSGSGQAAGAAAAALLPIELRQIAARYPVTLYTATDCPPCDSARQLLQQRGIPYAEKRVQSDEDVIALERLMGARTVPAATIGAQQLRGLSLDDWTAYLDAAGYPKESRLPRGWQPSVTPLVAAREAPVAAPRPSAAPPAAAPAEPATTPGAIRF